MNLKTTMLCLVYMLLLKSISGQPFITTKKTANSFPIVANNSASLLYVDGNDDAVVRKATTLLQQDIELVTGKKPVITNAIRTTKNIIIVGTIGKSGLVDQLVAQRKLKIDSVKGKWEAYQIQVVENPFKGVDAALVIAGSDRRGTAFGVFELSQQIGVSPWYYWADVPAKKKSEVYYTGGFKYDAPAVKYRGIFINDEAPALTNWSKEKFGGYNHKFYEKVFELILRMKGNYLWPAMWGSAFYDDDSLNGKTADEYAIVMGTSHHEPLGRAHDEWRRYGKGKWNYDSNEVRLKDFWKGGIARMRNNENIVSVGMRGDGDEPMTQGTAIALLERIVKDQRQIIKDVTGKPASETPQLWALYKEVQEYYDKGMRVPDDITLLLCDDNWGNIRKLPKLTDKPRSGGYGIYYHYDYVGGPRNYKWINTNQIERVCEQMHLAYKHGVDKIWIVNVGDIKPMEFPTQFFLDYAWKPNQWTADKLPDYYTEWASKQFGTKHAKTIGEIIAKYTKYNSRRKPELLDENTYSLHNYKEANRINDDYDQLLEQAEKLKDSLPKEYQDAYFQLVLHPVKASANLQNLYTSVAYNKWFYSNNWLVANRQANNAKQYYLKDSLITKEYHTIANGKWNHMMDQTHIGYTYWQQPEFNKMPEVRYVPVDSAVDQATLITPRSITAENLIPATDTGNIFYEKDGYVSIEAANYTKAVSEDSIKWQVIPNLGRTASAVTTLPVTEAPGRYGGQSSHLEYKIYFQTTGTVKINTYLSPTLPFHNASLRYAMSIDDEIPQIIQIHTPYNEGLWNKWVAENIIIKISEHTVTTKGPHILKYWLIDPGVVLQKIIVDAGGLKPSYLGPEETRIK